MKKIIFAGLMALFILPKAYGDGLPVYTSYSNYEVKRVTNTLYGVTGTDTVTNSWDWTRHVDEIWVVRYSSHPIWLTFQTAVDSYTYVAPTVSDTFCISGAIASDPLNNTFVFPVQSDEFSVYVGSNNLDGVANSTDVDIRFFGLGK